MLVLGRKSGQQIHIGTKQQFLNEQETVVKVWLSEDKKTIMIGIIAETDQKVLRQEIVVKTMAEWEQEKE